MDRILYSQGAPAEPSGDSFEGSPTTNPSSVIVARFCHHQIERRLAHRLQRGGTITDIENRVPSPLQDPAEQCPLGRFVVDHENPGQPRRRPSAIAYLE
jgi:hypothetical protein